MGGAWFEVAYLVAIILFISGIKQLGKVRTAKNGNRLASLAMLLVVIGAVGQLNERSHGAGVDWGWIIAGVIVGGGIGAVVAKKVQMTEMPEMVALFNGSGGAASVFVVLSFLANEISTTLKALPDSASLADAMGWDTTLALALSILIGGVTLTGSVVAYGKLSGKVTGDAVVYDMQHQINGGLILAALVLTALIGWVLGPGAAMSVSVFLALLSLGLGVLPPETSPLLARPRVPIEVGGEGGG